jgi:hypothetical protein
MDQFEPSPQLSHLPYGLDTVNVLFVCDTQRYCWHLARHLEQLGCTCWFASTAEELRILIDQHSFRLVVSTRPVTTQGSLMGLLRAPERFVFYSFRVEDGCLWVQALPEIPDGPQLSMLRPSEFMSRLDDIVNSNGQSRNQ